MLDVTPLEPKDVLCLNQKHPEPNPRCSPLPFALLPSSKRAGDYQKFKPQPEGGCAPSRQCGGWAGCPGVTPTEGAGTVPPGEGKARGVPGVADTRTEGRARDGATLFCWGKGHKPKCKKCHLNRRKKLFFVAGVICLYNGLQTETCKEGRLVPKGIHSQAGGSRVCRSTLTFFHEAGCWDMQWHGSPDDTITSPLPVSSGTYALNIFLRK